MKKFNLILLTFITFLSFHSLLNAQYLNIFGGVKLPQFNSSHITLAYRDESPAPDTFYAEKDLSNKPYYTLGVSFDNFAHKEGIYYNIIGQAFTGELFGIQGGLSLGYSFPLNKSITIVPALTSGFAYTNKKMGQLINNTVYIQVNSTRFGDYQNVNVGLTKTDFFVKPNINVFLDLSKKLQLRFSGSYLHDISMKQFIEFKSISGTAISDNEDADASNLFYFVNGVKSSNIPFNIRGLEFTIGVAINFGK